MVYTRKRDQNQFQGIALFDHLPLKRQVGENYDVRVAAALYKYGAIQYARIIICNLQIPAPSALAHFEQLIFLNAKRFEDR